MSPSRYLPHPHFSVQLSRNTDRALLDPQRHFQLESSVLRLGRGSGAFGVFFSPKNETNKTPTPINTGESFGTHTCWRSVSLFAEETKTQKTPTKLRFVHPTMGACAGFSWMPSRPAVSSMPQVWQSLKPRFSTPRPPASMSPVGCPCVCVCVLLCRARVSFCDTLQL